MFSESVDRAAFAKRLQSKLHVLRAAEGASQADIANALGVVRSTYVNYENGTKEIPWEKCLALLFFFEHNNGTSELLKALHILPEHMENKHK